MHSKLKYDFGICSLVSIGILSLAGCQGGLTSIPSLNSFNNPTRVPPPPTGSFQVPASYNDPSGGGASAARTRPTTLGQLRSIETGKSGGDRIESDGVLTTEVTNDAFAFTTKPVTAQSISTLDSSANQFNRSLEAASPAVFSAAVSSAASVSSARGAPADFNPVRTASSNFPSETNSPSIVSAASIQDLPSLRSNEAANGSLSSSEESVKWRTPQKR